MKTIISFIATIVIIIMVLSTGKATVATVTSSVAAPSIAPTVNSNSIYISTDSEMCKRQPSSVFCKDN